jgi:hypothetical protein
MDYLKLYSGYIANFNASLDCILQCRKKSSFQKHLYVSHIKYIRFTRSIREITKISDITEISEIVIIINIFIFLGYQGNSRNSKIRFTIIFNYACTKVNNN